MARFEQSKERNERTNNRDSTSSYSSRNNKSDGSFRDDSRGRRDSSSYTSRDRNTGGSSRNDFRGRRDSSSYTSRDRNTGGSFRDDSRGRRDSSREPKRYSRNRRDFEMTKVICSACGKECEVPFKPTSNKPIFCDKCYAKRDKGNFDNTSTNKDFSKDFEIINKKLDKIIKSLNIE